MAFLDYTGLSYFFDKLKLLFATKTEVSAKADSSHSHLGSEITLTGYAKASSASAVAATDTVNEAFGKVQKALDGKQASLTNMSSTELTTGTATTARSISAKVIADYVAGKLAELVDSSPGALDTLNELAAALGNDPNFATTIAGQIAAKADATHSHVGSEVTLTGYAKASSASAVAATDTVNAAFGKVQKSIEAKAADSAVVHNTGTETIAGPKTFTSDINIHEANPSVICDVTGTVKGTAPSADKVVQMGWYDGSGTDGNAQRYGGAVLTLYANGNVRAGCMAFKNAAGATASAGIYAVYPASGDPYGTAPETPASGNDSDIVTRGFLASALTNQTAISTSQIDALFLAS